jgi:hypothetical protein
MLGWIAVHVHANKVAAQLQIISDKDLMLLQDGQSLTSSVGIEVPLEIASEAQTKGMHKDTTKGRRVMLKLKVYFCSSRTFFKAQQHGSPASA